MAKIILRQGDCFSYTYGFGIKISDHIAVFIEGEGDRTGRTIRIGNVPADAALENSFPAEVKLALEAATAVLQLRDLL